jgi:hypothetical protein
VGIVSGEVCGTRLSKPPTAPSLRIGSGEPVLVGGDGDELFHLPSVLAAERRFHIMGVQQLNCVPIADQPLFHGNGH